MTKFSDTAKKYYEDGLSCSEAIINAAHDCNISNFGNIEDVQRIASMFSGGMSSGCLCGAVAGSQIVLGSILGRGIADQSRKNREIAALFIQKFKAQRKITCCNGLSAPFKNIPEERRKNCANIVEECAIIVEDVIKSHINI